MPEPVSPAKTLPLPLVASPAGIVTTGIMIYDVDHHTISHQKCSPQATVGGSESGD
jgi:hypothetical protein